jgi:hypothetical protein
MKIVLGLFQPTDAMNAINGLRDAGFNYDDMSVLSSAAQMPTYLEGDPEDSAVSGAAIGGVAGGVAGALGAWAVPAIPGFEAMAATGLLTTAAGSVMGGFLGSLYSVRAESKTQIDIHEALESGQVLLLVKTVDENEDRAKEVLESSDGHSVQIHDFAS